MFTVPFCGNIKEKTHLNLEESQKSLSDEVLYKQILEEILDISEEKSLPRDASWYPREVVRNSSVSRVRSWSY